MTPHDEQRDMFGARKGEYELPAHAQLRTCHTCNAPVVRIQTAKKRFMPLSIATIEERAGVKYALSHFIDCPDATKWSKR